jgi:hypothetical protein
MARGAGVNNKLGPAACRALRAWLAADREGLTPDARGRLLSEARRLTGLAVGEGLLGPLDTRAGRQPVSAPGQSS